MSIPQGQPHAERRRNPGESSTQKIATPFKAYNLKPF
jgi:hypothetical protein